MQFSFSFTHLISTHLISRLGQGFLNASLNYTLLSSSHYEENLEELKKNKGLKALHLFFHHRPLGFAIFFSELTSTLIHETGHLAATHLLYQNCVVDLTLWPSKGGNTRSSCSRSSQLGEYLGNERSRSIICAAGPAFGILASTFFLAGALLSKNRSYEFRSYLTCLGFVIALTEITYALSLPSSDHPEPEGYDYYHLREKEGILPIAAAVTLAALPLMVYISLALRHKQD